MSARLAATPFLCTAIAAVSERHAATGIVGHISAGLKRKSAAVSSCASQSVSNWLTAGAQVRHATATRMAWPWCIQKKTAFFFTTPIGLCLHQTAGCRQKTGDSMHWCFLHTLWLYIKRIAGESPCNRSSVCIKRQGAAATVATSHAICAPSSVAYASTAFATVRLSGKWSSNLGPRKQKRAALQ